MGLDSDQGKLQEEKSHPSILPKPKQNFRDLLRQQIKSIQNDLEVVPVSHDYNRNFATVNRTYFRLMKSLPPKIPVQPVNFVAPVLPDMAHSNDISNKPKLVTAEDAPAILISQAQQELLLYLNGQPPLSLKKCEPVKSSQTVNQDRDIALSNDNTQILPNRTSSSPSEYNYHHTQFQPVIAFMKHPSQTHIQNHCTMQTVCMKHHLSLPSLTINLMPDQMILPT